MLNFIKINEYVIKVDEILYIKEVGQGCHIVCKFGTIDIAKLDEGVLDCIYGKINEAQELEPVVSFAADNRVDYEYEHEMNSKEDTPEINCIWSRCIMCTHFCQTTDYATRPGVVKIRCGKWGWKREVEEEAIDTFGPDDWEEEK